MNLNELRERIEIITGCTIIEHTMNEEDWENKAKKETLIPVMQSNHQLTVWKTSFIEGKESDEKARSIHQKQVYQLLELLLPSVSGWQPLTSQAGLELDHHTRELGQWIVRQLSSRNPIEDIPEEYHSKINLRSSMIPFLLVTESLQAGSLNPKQLEKLLISYFEQSIILIPLQDDEWFILASHDLIEDTEQMDIRGSHRDRDKHQVPKEQSKEHTKEVARDLSGESEDTEEDLLTAFALGLYELVASEWVGSFHISVRQPIYPDLELVKSVEQLRETIHLGQLFHVTEHIHLPWELRLESLLYRIPEDERLRFVESADHHSHLFNDEETVATLETFFKKDCNVSETAKQLYIHRNTLLYRLDKIKQDTQLDVRKFEDAVLMRLTLLLYKVTKS